MEDTNITFPTDQQVETFKVPTEGSVVTIKRETPKERIIDFVSASALDDEVLDFDSNQMAYVLQETLDDLVEALRLGTDDAWDAGSKAIRNLGVPQEDSDAVTKKYADEIINIAQSYANSALQSAQSAANSADEAAASAAQAEADANFIAQHKAPVISDIEPEEDVLWIDTSI